MFRVERPSQEETEAMDVRPQAECADLCMGAGRQQTSKRNQDPERDRRPNQVDPDKTHLQGSSSSLTDNISPVDREASFSESAAFFKPDNPSTKNCGVQNRENSPAPAICTPPCSSPNHLSALSSKSNVHICLEKKRLTSTSSSNQHSLKSTAAQIQQVAGDELCASLVLACLFCRLGDCLLVVGEGCSLTCSSLCCCGSLLSEAMACACGRLWLHCSIWDLCLHSSECLELGMEVSQLLFH